MEVYRIYNRLSGTEALPKKAHYLTIGYFQNGIWTPPPPNKKNDNR